MLCDWCDEPIVTETGDYEIVYSKPAKHGSVTRWNESWYHDYCFEDGTRGEDVTEDENGELVIL